MAWHATRIADVSGDATALVMGAGPVGLAVVLALRAQGVRRIFVREPSARRLQMAREFGAVVAPVDLEPVDVAFDAAGAGEASFTPALNSVRLGGTMVVVAHFRDPVAVDLSRVMQSEVIVRGSIADTRADFRAVIEAVHSGRLDPTPLVTREIALEDLVTDGLQRLQTPSGRVNDVKILVTPMLAGRAARGS